MSSQKWIDYPQVIDLVRLVKKLSFLSADELIFILNWHTFVGKKDQEFGFIGLRGLEDQTKEAVPFFLRTQRAWQDAVRDCKTTDSFEEYFYKTAIAEGIVLPDDFVGEMLKRRVDEHSRTEDLG